MQKFKDAMLKFGFTSSEMRVALFLVLVLFAGSIVRYLYSLPENRPAEKYDYSIQDSLFYLGVRKNPDTVKTVRNIEKKVASEQELLDFTDDNFSKRDKTIPKIYEKSVNINLADKSTLILLPSIGKKTADKIIGYRLENGGFEKIEDIMNVKGIGPAKFDKIKKYIDIK